MAQALAGGAHRFPQPASANLIGWGEGKEEEDEERRKNRRRISSSSSKIRKGRENKIERGKG